jgi:multiple sugar transport system permease protein
VASVAARGSKRGGSAARRVLDWAGDLPFLLPIVVLIGVLIVLPTVIAIVYSFTNWNPGYPSPFVGLQNYETLAKSAAFHTILANEAFMLIGLPIWVGVPFIIAFMLHERVPAAGIFRAIYFFPAIASPALIGILFTFILAPSGPLDSALGLLGIHNPPQWLVSVAWVKPVLIAVLAWATIGIGVIIFSAGLSAVPEELFEAAQIDGATWWRRLRHIALPSLRNLVELWTVLLVITVFVALFPWVFTLTRGGPGYSSTTMDYDIYQQAFSFGNFGLAAAEMVIMLCFLALILFLGWLVFFRKKA